MWREGTPAWMQVVEPHLEQAAEAVERRQEQAAEESSGLIKTFPLEREYPFLSL